MLKRKLRIQKFQMKHQINLLQAMTIHHLPIMMDLISKKEIHYFIPRGNPGDL
jgi:hypothetical protein